MKNILVNKISLMLYSFLGYFFANEVIVNCNIKYLSNGLVSPAVSGYSNVPGLGLGTCLLILFFLRDFLHISIIDTLYFVDEVKKAKQVDFLRGLKDTLGFRPYFYLLMLNIFSWLGFQVRLGERRTNSVIEQLKMLRSMILVVQQ